MKKSIVIAVAVLVFLLCQSITGASNLIQNGSFEYPGITGNVGPGRERYDALSTSLTGWTLGSSGNVYILQTPFDGGPTFNPAQDGSFYLDLSGEGSVHADIYQDFPTSIGTQYRLNFYIGSASTLPSSTIYVQLTGVNTLLSKELTPPIPINSLTWLEETFTFTADSSTTRLSFVDTSNIDDNASFVDNVSVSASAPDSGSTLLLLFIALPTVAFFRLH